MKKKQYIAPSSEIILSFTPVMNSITWGEGSAPEEGDANKDTVWEEEEYSTKNVSLWDD